MTGREYSRFEVGGQSRPCGAIRARVALVAMLAAAPALARDMPLDEARAIVQAAEQQRIDVMARVAPSVVCIFDEDRGGGGAGVIITPDGFGVTNFHVVATMMKSRKGLGGLSDGELYPLEVLGIDPTGDVAMFRLGGRAQFEPAILGDSDLVRVGDDVFAMGNPFGVADDYTPTVTYGIVSGIHRYQFGAGARQLVYTDCIQVDASINPGNSGGPLFDMAGRVIGINGRASFEQRGRVNVGVGYAITINQIKRFIPGLRAGLLTEHGSLAATTIDLGYRRVVFEKMLEPSVASAAGIQIGDRLIRFAGREIHSSNQFANILNVFPAGWPVEVVFEHEDRQITRRIRLERLPLRSAEAFEPDDELNRRETRRVLEACWEALGQPAAPSAALEWNGRRTLYDATLPGGDVPLRSSATEAADGTSRLKLTDDQGQTVAEYEYNGRIAHQRDPQEGLVEVSAVDAERLNLWLAARRALYQSFSDERLDQWRVIGGDAWDDAVLDLLEFTSTEGRDIQVGIHPETHLPARVMWKPLDAPSADRPRVEMELFDWKAVDGRMLPHRIRTLVGGTLAAEDAIESYHVGGAP